MNNLVYVLIRPYLDSIINFIAVLSSPSISISAKAGTQTKSMPLGATKPRAIATAFTA